jgi:cell division protein FtsB
MNRPKRRLTVRWRRLAGLVIAGYFAASAAHSGWQWWVISRQAAAVQNRTRVVERQNRQLAQELKALNNPGRLKAVLSGQATVPIPTAPQP